jgi:hypothetical protein
MGQGLEPRTVFLDSGVIIDGCYSEWSVSKALLILTAQHPHHFMVVLAEAVDTEVRAALVRKLRQPGARDVLAAYDGWRSAVQLRYWPLPTRESLSRYMHSVLPALRHVNDLRAAVSAIEAQPDWVLSTNDAHWGTALAAVSGLRVAHPWAFLDYLSSQRP